MIKPLLHNVSSPYKTILMTLKKGLLILAFLTTSEFIFIGCSNQNRQIFELQIEEDKAVTPEILISQYDPIMRRVAAEQGLDWRFIAAIGYHESRFQNEVISPMGAVGLMQVIPSVARSYGVTADSITIPEVNIETAVKVIKTIEQSLRFSPNTSTEDKLKIILACYNGGIGHVVDAIRLAAKYGANYCSWTELEKYLKIKGSAEFVDDEVVKCGAFNSGETVNFVKVVMQQYHKYCNMYPMA